MNGFMKFITNKYIYVPILLWFFIQAFKVICDLIKNRRFNFKRILGAGGMPSSHSAIVVSLATLIGKYEGVDSSIFALSLIVAFVVMYDACGIRRAAGKQARILNKIIETPRINPNGNIRKISRSSRTYSISSICWSINRIRNRINSINLLLCKLKKL